MNKQQLISHVRDQLDELGATISQLCALHENLTDLVNEAEESTDTITSNPFSQVTVNPFVQTQQPVVNPFNQVAVNPFLFV